MEDESSFYHIRSGSGTHAARSYKLTINNNSASDLTYQTHTMSSGKWTDGCSPKDIPQYTSGGFTAESNGFCTGAVGTVTWTIAQESGFYSTLYIDFSIPYWSGNSVSFTVTQRGSVYSINPTTSSVSSSAHNAADTIAFQGTP